MEASAEVDLAEGVEVAPAYDQEVDVLVVDVLVVDVLVVDVERLGLDEAVVVAATGVVGVDVVDVEATVDVLHVAMDIGAAEQVGVIENSSRGIVAPMRW